MSAKRGFKALNGDWENISNTVFKITENMTMEFRGKSYNIINKEGDPVEQLGEGDGQVSREVLAGYRYYVMRAWVKFERKSE